MKEKTIKKANIRKIALELLMSYEAGERYVNLLLSSPKTASLSREESAALTALLYTTVERKLTYDYFICAISGRSIDKISPRAQNILRLGLCQLLHMDSVPDFAAVSESVKLCGSPSERGFVNAVLRRASDLKGNLPYPKREKNEARYLSVFYSFPQPLVKHFIGLVGVGDAELLLKAMSEEPPLTLTVNTEKTDREKLVLRLGSLDPVLSTYTDCGIKIQKKIPPRSIGGFDEGDFFVQDEASELAVSLLGIDKGMKIADVCAAPGGKSFLAAMKTGKSGCVYSFDIHESKLSLIEEGARRLGLSNIKVGVNDAERPSDELIGQMDRVICDVPCSGLGVLAKKPDLRYKDLSALKTLPKLQYSILEASVRYLKTGGIIGYSTCTLNPDENEKVTDRFIEEHPDFEYVTREVAGIGCVNGKLTLYPHIHGTDGFYISIMRKKDL